MSSKPRTFSIESPLMKGNDIQLWQRDIPREFEKMGIDNCPIVVTGSYDVATRSYTASLCHALGLDAGHEMAKGVTPALRSKIRNRTMTPAEDRLFHSAGLVAYRRALRARWAAVKTHMPVTKILADDWGYHPGVHDGLDVICLPNATVFAMCKAKVFDVRASGWWGLGAAPSGGHAVSEGDGIVQLQVLEDLGPFKKGHHIGYGHVEHAKVKQGDVVEAGDAIALAGFAKAWHIHLMYNDGSTSKGIGNIDPRAILDYTVRHG